jgi:hypothetical protein
LKDEGEELCGFQGESSGEKGEPKWCARSEKELLRKTVGEGGRRRAQRQATPDFKTSKSFGLEGRGGASAHHVCESQDDVVFAVRVGAEGCAATCSRNESLPCVWGEKRSYNEDDEAGKSRSAVQDGVDPLHRIHRAKSAWRTGIGVQQKGKHRILELTKESHLGMLTPSRRGQAREQGPKCYKIP